MNEVGYDAMAPGNHDFNYGANSLVSMQGNMEFDLLSANVTKDGNNPFKTSKIYIKGDKKIGVIGLTTPETVTKADPRKVEGYSFNAGSLAKILQDEINSLKSQDVDYIVVLGHLGVDEESAHR